MPYCNYEPKRDPNFDNHPSTPQPYRTPVNHIINPFVRTYRASVPQTETTFTAPLSQGIAAAIRSVFFTLLLLPGAQREDIVNTRNLEQVFRMLIAGLPAILP